MYYLCVYSHTTVHFISEIKIIQAWCREYRNLHSFLSLRVLYGQYIGSPQWSRCTIYVSIPILQFISLLSGIAKTWCNKVYIWIYIVVFLWKYCKGSMYIESPQCASHTIYVSIAMLQFILLLRWIAKTWSNRVYIWISIVVFLWMYCKGIK